MPSSPVESGSPDGIGLVKHVLLYLGPFRKKTRKKKENKKHLKVITIMDVAEVIGPRWGEKLDEGRGGAEGVSTTTAARPMSRRGWEGWKGPRGPLISDP